MKNLFLLVIAFSFAEMAWAESEMTCVVQELENDETTYQVLKVPITESAHGSIVNFATERVSGVQGMVAIMKGRAVISLYDTATKIGSSSHAMAVQGEVVHHQIMLPSENEKTRAVSVDCRVG